MKYLKTFFCLMSFSLVPEAFSVDFAIDVPLTDKSRAENTSLQEMELNLNEDIHFPTPACLTKNVVFWENIYRDYDTNVAVFHDRDSLSRVYGVATLPTSETSKNNAEALYKEYFSEKLRELATLIAFPDKQDKIHRDLANKFSSAELNYNSIMRASQNIRIQTGLKSRFEQGITRSLQYLPTVQKIIAAQNLPMDIAFLPHVESGYHPRAMSKVGAVGLWQIMPDTMRLLLGRQYVSRRTEVEPATQAAIKLLKQNYQATKSWPLALTAYNHGLNGILKAIKATKSRDLCTVIEKYESPSFKFASSNFYAQFLAARNVALERYHVLAENGNNRIILRSLLAKK